MAQSQLPCRPWPSLAPHLGSEGSSQCNLVGIAMRVKVSALTTFSLFHAQTRENSAVLGRPCSRTRCDSVWITAEQAWQGNKAKEPTSNSRGRELSAQYCG